MTQYFIDDWKRAYKFLSVRLTALLIAIASLYDMIPVMRELFPPPWFSRVSMFIGVCIIIARIIKVPAPPIGAPEAPPRLVVEEPFPPTIARVDNPDS